MKKVSVLSILFTLVLHSGAFAQSQEIERALDKDLNSLGEVRYSIKDVTCSIQSQLKVDRYSLIGREFIIAKNLKSMIVKNKDLSTEYVMNPFDKNSLLVTPKESSLIDPSFFLKVTDDGLPVSINEMDSDLSKCGGGLVVSEIMPLEGK